MSLTLPFLNEIALSNGQFLTLRKVEIEDAPRMLAFFNIVGGESENLLYSKGEFPLTLEQTTEYIRRKSNNPSSLMVIGIIDTNIVSFAQINSPLCKRIAHNSSIDISVKKEYWRKGIGSSLLQELLKFAREQGLIKNISLGVRASNNNAIGLYERFGFKVIGVHKDYFNVNGVFDDEILMDLQL
jgi:ribosomal protein S18 acetylase RimI-like enzyme